MSKLKFIFSRSKPTVYACWFNYPSEHEKLFSYLWVRARDWPLTNTTWYMRHHALFRIRQNVYFANVTNEVWWKPFESLVRITCLFLSCFIWFGVSTLLLTMEGNRNDDHVPYTSTQHLLRTCIVPKFYTRWQQRSRKTTVVKSYISVAFRLPSSSITSCNQPRDLTYFSIHTVSCIGQIFHKHCFIVTWIIQRNYWSIYVGPIYTIASQNMFSFSLQKFPSGLVL